MTHNIIWTLDFDSIRSNAECDDADCISRYTCPEWCEWISDIRRDETGVSHGVIDWEGETKPHLRHTMKLGDTCNFIEFLTADPYVIPELHDGGEAFEIGRTPIEPVWKGEDEVMWKRITPTRDDLAEARDTIAALRRGESPAPIPLEGTQP